MIENIVFKYGLIGVFVLIFLEYFCFPIPSEGVIPLLAIFVEKYHYSFLGIYLLTIVISLIAITFLYTLSYYFGDKLLNYIYDKYKFTNKGIDKTREVLLRYPKTSLILARIIPLTRTYISLICGVFKYDFLLYLVYSFIGISIWNGILMLLGILFINNIHAIALLYRNYKLLILGVVSVSIILLLKLKKR